MGARKVRTFVGDFETTVYKGQEDTEVWASASVELYTEDAKVFHSIDEQFDYFLSLKSNIICYYHNLKFDGTFWLSYLMTVLHFQQATEKISEDTEAIQFLKPRDMPSNTFTYSISGMGQWYRIIIKVGRYTIELRDSLKLLPFSVKELGRSFKTKHRKLDMEYTGFRYAGCVITPEEEQYIKNDILVVKEAIEIMFQEGHSKLTIGSCCLAEYQRLIGKKKYDEWFPNLYELEIPDTYGAVSAGEYVRKSYKGGWCYLVKGKASKVYKHGITADVNSLYPSMMSSESGNFYPIGLPTFWKGSEIPEEALDNLHYFFVRIKTKFYIKKNKLPFIQAKGTWLYKPNEMLETSDIFNPKDGKYYDEYINLEGERTEARMEMTLTQTDFQLFLEHYDVVDFEILDGCYFRSAIGIFDCYIDKYKQIKLESTGARRQLAKLFLNNLYGKMASSTSSNFKVAYVKDNGAVGFYEQIDNSKTPGYIPVGSAITSYARNFTIRAAQKNYHGVDQDGFIYADTDSIHCSLSADEIEGIKVHPKNFCCWKIESTWDLGFFVRQKTYIEHVIEEDQEPIDMPYYSVRCAGMPQKSKELFIKSMEGYTYNENDEYTDEERQFLVTKRNVSDFDTGLKVPGKLVPKRIRGGTLLVETTYEMR